MTARSIFTLPPGWDASPWQGYPPALSSPALIHPPGWTKALLRVECLAQKALTTQCPRPGTRFSKAQETFRAVKP